MELQASSRFAARPEFVLPPLERVYSSTLVEAHKGP
jgi:hypothetical protein